MAGVPTRAQYYCFSYTELCIFLYCFRQYQSSEWLSRHPQNDLNCVRWYVKLLVFVVVCVPGVFSVNCSPRKLCSRPAKNLPYYLWSAACVAHRILPCGLMLSSCLCGQHSGHTKYIGDVSLKNFHSTCFSVSLITLSVWCYLITAAWALVFEYSAVYK